MSAHVPPVQVGEPITFERALPDLVLEAGARVTGHHVTGWFWGSEEDTKCVQRGARLEANVSTVLLLHPLTSSAEAGGPQGFWTELIGKGRALRPWATRIVCFNVLGSCFGSSGPCDAGFPMRMHDTRFSPPVALARGDLGYDETKLPATVTPWDQARAILLALTALGIDNVVLAAGGSTGGMIAQCLLLLAPSRFPRVMTIAAPLASTASMIGWNHAAREAVLRDEHYPRAIVGLSVARQIARMSYRAQESLEMRHGRRSAGPLHEGFGAFSPRMPYRVATYLRHHGDTFAAAFHAPSYVCLTLAMDHHDLTRLPDDAAASLGDNRVWNVRIPSDTLVSPASQDALSTFLRDRGAVVTNVELPSLHGHDGFLTEVPELGRILREAMESPARTERSTSS